MTNLTSAKWISGTRPSSAEEYRALYLRTNIKVGTGVLKATATVSSLGWYKFFVNGENQSGDALVPRWTPFDKYVEFQDYDITTSLKSGVNIIALSVGDGRFRGRIGANSRQAVYGDELAGYVYIQVEYQDKSKESFLSDSSWMAGEGRIGLNDPMLGENVDLRIPESDWLNEDICPTRFENAREVVTSRKLIPEEVGRVMGIDTLKPISIKMSKTGTQVIDFGQNAVGIVKILLQGKAGRKVRLTHGEVLNSQGEVDIKYLAIPPITKPWSQTDEVILNGEKIWWQPWFTIHGFRYVEISGLDQILVENEIEFIVISSLLSESGSFESSNFSLNKLYENVKWSMRSNFTDTPTDCPTRERSGWTGDFQVFAPTATHFADVSMFLRRYIRNLEVEQLKDGRVPIFIPSESSEFSGGLNKFYKYLSSSTGWGDAAVELPLTLLRYYNDLESLELGYPAAKRWVDYLALKASSKRSLKRRISSPFGKYERYIVDTGFNWGEWLRPGENFLSSAADSIFRSGSSIATAYLEHSSRQLAEIAKILGKDSDSQRYLELATNTRAAWRATFIDSNGKIGQNRQDDYVRALSFELLDVDEKLSATNRLAKLIEEADFHLATGFLSTPSILSVLVENNRPDVAAKVLLQNSTPSWISQIERGATTTWETWEGYDRKGNAKASHNHYAYGAVVTFLVEKLAGISPAEPGYKVINIAPHPLPGIDFASATVQTPFGPSTVNWNINNRIMEVSFNIPVGSQGQLKIHSETEYFEPGEYVRRFELSK